MSFPKKKILLLVSYAMIILIYIPVMVLSSGSNNVTIQSRGTIVLRHEFPPSNFTYRIFQNSTFTYRISTLGYVDDHNEDPAVVINNALWDCSAAGGGSIYVVPDTYQTATPLGSTTIGKNWTNIYLCLGSGTIVNFTGAVGGAGHMLELIAAGAYVVNFTLTSNGTAYFNGGGYNGGIQLQNTVNCTFSNINIQHTNGEDIVYQWARYCDFENLTMFSSNEAVAANAAFSGNDMQYCTYKNITIDGNNNALTRGAVYIGDWTPHALGSTTNLGVGSYFNTWSQIWIKNFRRTGFYLNAGATGWSVYNNTFTNCIIENNWQGAYPAIKLRPAQNNTFTDIVIRNMTDAVTTGTSYLDSETAGNCTGNSITATIDGCTLTSFILTTDDDNQAVDHNFFNLTIANSKGTYFSSGTNSPIHDNICYLNMINSGSLYFESGYFQNNMFVMNFLNCGVDGHADIRFLSPLDPNITNNRIYILSESGNPHGQLEGSLGTNQIINGPP